MMTTILGILGLDLLRELEAVLPGQVDVHEDEIRRLNRMRSIGLIAVLGFQQDHGRKMGAERLPQQQAIVGAVFDDQGSIGQKPLPAGIEALFVPPPFLPRSIFFK